MPPRPTRILVVDDHPLLREGIASVLESESDMRIVAEAANGREAVDAFRGSLPDVVLMDLQMPELDGVAAIEAIRAEFPAARIIVVTTYRGDAQAVRALKAGAQSYLLKSSLRKELVETIRATLAGRRRIPPEVAAEIAAHSADAELTSRELDVLKGVAGGNSNKLVAAQLNVTEETVKAHMKSILAKLGANDRTHAVTIALRRGILQL
ncbi:response regulator transcription factor [Lysobacter firmicutimachus]|uniref:Response regulator transcription factor n=1 Tax=Lysobacter firmicutimachus TaxID=1792846 RepID=A0AAU8MY53_9GAMM|nr:response regulator transcription factor [Lysobacter antibioticus]